ncbi:translation initiation factor IF-2 isoform X1 [Gallus gallus]|uniref:translation initiation factor IF-2 isoform X1 n=1 Tax=Gallus gallus TaxID=9031 RepID=UPI001F007D9F|nr:translation initiation factor IF-2 isoform X1 [Gallus gallus]
MHRPRHPALGSHAQAGVRTDEPRDPTNPSHAVILCKHDLHPHPHSPACLQPPHSWAAKIPILPIHPRRSDNRNTHFPPDPLLSLAAAPRSSPRETRSPAIPWPTGSPRPRRAGRSRPRPSRCGATCSAAWRGARPGSARPCPAAREAGQGGGRAGPRDEPGGSLRPRPLSSSSAAAGDTPSLSRARESAGGSIRGASHAFCLLLKHLELNSPKDKTRGS